MALAFDALGYVAGDRLDTAKRSHCPADDFLATFHFAPDAAKVLHQGAKRIGLA
jgi:hypothetical protein